MTKLSVGLIGTGSWAQKTHASYRNAIDALVTSIRTGQPHECDVRYGLRLTEILAQAEHDIERA